MSQQPEPQSQPEDKLFPLLELPTELQLSVWKFAVPPPRNIKIGCHLSSSSTEYENVKLNSNTPPSALLSTCRNSRQMYLEANTSVIKMNILGSGTLFFDAENEIVVLGPKKQWVEDEVRSRTIVDAGMFAAVKTLAVSKTTAATLHESRCVANLFTKLQVVLVTYNRTIQLGNEADQVEGICFKKMEKSGLLSVLENFVTLIRMRVALAKLTEVINGERGRDIPDIRIMINCGLDLDFV